MSGGGAHNPPQPPPLSDPNVGEYLLKLLQKPNQTQNQTLTQPPPQQPQPLPLDPAVAVVGPAVVFAPWTQSNGQDLTNTPWLTQNLFSHGFSQNPRSSPSFHQNPNPQFPLNPQFSLNPQFEDVRKLGFSGAEIRDQTVHNVFRNQYQPESKLMFGSLAFPNHHLDELSNGNSVFGDPRVGFGLNSEIHNRGFTGLENGFPNSVDSVRNRQSDSRVNLNSSSSSIPIRGNLNSNNQDQKWGSPQHGGSYRFAPPEPRRAPPGFPNKPRSGMNWDSGNKIQSEDRNVGNERDRYSSDYWLNGGDDNVGRLLHGHSKTRGNKVEVGLSDRFDRPGPPVGSKLHSVSALDVEESLMDLHKVGEERELSKQAKLTGDRDSLYDQARDEFDELSEEIVGSLVLGDGSSDKNDERKLHRTRDKDFRSDSRGKQILGQRMRNFKSHIECRGDINRLNASFLAIYESLIPAEEEKAKQKQLLTLLQNIVTKEWPKAQLYLYGSCANSFGVSKSDIDVCLAIEDADVNKSEVLLKLADILQGDNLENVQALTRARVPIVKLLDPATGISCDICINNVLAVVNTKLLRDYAQLDLRLRQLAFIIKHWAKSRGVNETYQGTLSSYAYVLMCIHFLQQRRPAILPCLQGMKTTYSVTIEGVECAFFDKVELLRDFGSRNKESIAQLVWAFFNYWAYCHDYTNNVISVRTGTILSKRAKEWTRRIGNDRHLICIEDPFETSHDLGRVVDKYSIKVLREEFERAAEIMQYDPNPCVALFQPYVPN